jgi:hypothetical protein
MRHTGLFDSADEREPALQSCARQACSFAARDRLAAYLSAHGQEAKAAAGGVETRAVFMPAREDDALFSAAPTPAASSASLARKYHAHLRRQKSG